MSDWSVQRGEWEGGGGRGGSWLSGRPLAVVSWRAGLGRKALIDRPFLLTQQQEGRNPKNYSWEVIFAKSYISYYWALNEKLWLKTLWAVVNTAGWPVMVECWCLSPPRTLVSAKYTRGTNNIYFFVICDTCFCVWLICMIVHWYLCDFKLQASQKTKQETPWLKLEAGYCPHCRSKWDVINLIFSLTYVLKCPRW